MNARISASPSHDFVISRPQPEAALRLLCFPHAGAGPVTFYPWIAHLAPEIECVCAQYPGRGYRLRETPLTAVSALVDGMVRHWDALADRPCAFYGHSLGAWVAFELARELRRRGLPGPAHLFVGASRPPHLGPLQPPIRALPEAEFLAALQFRYGGIPAAIFADPQALSLFAGAMRADMTACELYQLQHEPPLEIPLTAIAATDDRVVPPSIVEQWAGHTSASFVCEWVSGGHFFPPSTILQVTQMIRRALLSQPAIEEGQLA